MNKETLQSPALQVLPAGAPPSVALYMVIAIVAAIPPTLAAVATIIIGLHSSQKIDKVDVQTNHNLEVVTRDLKGANDRIEKLQELVARMANASGVVTEAITGKAVKEGVPNKK
jgi:hypothetical protein